jgi:adenine-specific DNA-methyltransferase
MSKNIDSLKHKDKRAHIPSNEEAGYEDVNVKVKQGKDVLQLPKNPVVHRGQDPELFWMNKYGNDDREDLLKVDIRSLYRHEHIAPEQIIKGLYKTVVEKKDDDQLDMFSTNELFGNALEHDELEKVSEYYQHSDGWTNRLIQGDSHLVMASLLEREGMAGQAQLYFMDPPYGINYGSNWQMSLNSNSMSYSNPDEDVSGEPETIKAFRDTWTLGIHSYLSYLRDRLIIAKELLEESGSVVVQIGEDNLHLVRNILDEIFGAENFIAIIAFKKKKMPLGEKFIFTMCDYMVWYAKDRVNAKFRRLYQSREYGIDSDFNYLELVSGEVYSIAEYLKSNDEIPKNARFFQSMDMRSSGRTKSCVFDFEFDGKKFNPGSKSWKTNFDGMKKLKDLKRLFAPGNSLRYKLYYDDYPVTELSHIWTDTQGATGKSYVVQTSEKVMERIILMITDPGDLILDPTCGGGTTAYIAEKLGRRWITVDTSRVALNLAKKRMLSAVYPSFKLHDEQGKDIRQGFHYKSAKHVTLGALANEEPMDEVILYDQPIEDQKKLRVAGPFTVETLQNFEPVNPELLDDKSQQVQDNGTFEERIFDHLKSAGVKNGIKNEQAVFIRVEKLADSYLHAEGFYLNSEEKEQKAYFHIGPKFGTVAKQAVNEAVKSCRQRGDADWLIILGFSFESDISNQNVTMSVGSFEVTKVRMHDDLMQDGLLKKDKKAASFVTIGEPDIELHKNGESAQVEVCGLDIYDPIKDVVKARNIEDIAYWMVDDDYDGSNFVVKQVFFCGGKKDEFKKWKKGLDNLAKTKTKKKVEHTLKIEIDDEAFDRLYGFKSHPFEIKKKQKIAVRVISQFGEESTKVLTI